MSDCNIKFVCSDRDNRGVSCQYEVYSAKIDDALLFDLSSKVTSTLTSDKPSSPYYKSIRFLVIKCFSGLSRSKKNFSFEMKLTKSDGDELSYSVLVSVFDSEEEAVEYHKLEERIMKRETLWLNRQRAAIEILSEYGCLTKSECAEVINRRAKRLEHII